jgi:hypothetical protein
MEAWRQANGRDHARFKADNQKLSECDPLQQMRMPAVLFGKLQEEVEFGRDARY